jgi:hypothetical protein
MLNTNPATQGHSARWIIREAVKTALQNAPELFELPIVVNPREASSLGVGKRVLVIKEQSDALQSQTGTLKSGFTEKRVFNFSVACVSRVADVGGADDDVDLLHVSARAAVFACFEPLRAVVQSLEYKENNVMFEVENLDIDGALVLSNWEVTYTKKRTD